LSADDQVLLYSQHDLHSSVYFVLYNEELHNLYVSPNNIRVIKEDDMGGACSTHGRDKYKILVGKPKVKRSHERPRHRWEDNIRMAS
jgi:hypothetical protein